MLFVESFLKHNEDRIEATGLANASSDVDLYYSW